MYHKGLSREQVIQTAVRMIEDNGMERFSLHALARELGVRTASLYKHISGMDDLITEVGRYAYHLQKEQHESAIAGKTGDEAIMALGYAYRSFATEHYELYCVIFRSISLNEELKKETHLIPEPIMNAMDAYQLEPLQCQHWQRIFRSLMHGFIVHEREGYFAYYDVDKEETFRLALLGFIHAVKAGGAESGIS